MAQNELTDFLDVDNDNTDIHGTTIVQAQMYPFHVDNAFRNLAGMLARFTGDDTLVATATTNLGSVPGRYIVVTGNTGISAFGTIKAGTLKFLKFSGTPILTHNATSLILPGAVNKQVVAGDAAIMVSEGGGNWRCLAYLDASASSADTVHYTAETNTAARQLQARTNIGLTLGYPLLEVVDEKTTGTNAANSAVTTWNTRALNTIKTNEIGATVASNQVTITVAGTYRTYDSSAPGYRVGFHKTRLRNITAGTTILVGTSEYANTASTGDVSTRSFISGRFVISTVPTVLEFQHYTAALQTNGLGQAAGGSEVETYATLKIERLA